MAIAWEELRGSLNITEDEEQVIELEKELIRTMIRVREEKGLTQKQLAELCDVKQPVIARMESAVHSPQINSLLKVLVPLGYTLEIVPLEKKG
ncbi:MAG: XRE family transcriptional regulator [Lachnospiraceae bacterium]|nr:XRE family transcriptional regulator [Lachnospiraceae bacterium]MBQ6994772.1 XRE family transcriptional regulator [Lachnospiraceae bacterium]